MAAGPDAGAGAVCARAARVEGLTGAAGAGAAGVEAAARLFSASTRAPGPPALSGRGEPDPVRAAPDAGAADAVARPWSAGTGGSGVDVIDSGVRGSSTGASV